MSTVIWLTVAVGIAQVLQAQFMGVMTDRIGTLESVFITYGLGGALAGIAVIFARGGNLGEWRAVPPYALLAGVAGLVIVFGLGVAVTKVGIATTLTATIAVQFFAAAIVDHFGMFEAVTRPITGTRAVGLLTVLVGTWLVVK